MAGGKPYVHHYADHKRHSHCDGVGFRENQALSPFARLIRQQSGYRLGEYGEGESSERYEGDDGKRCAEEAFDLPEVHQYVAGEEVGDKHKRYEARALVRLCLRSAVDKH